MTTSPDSKNLQLSVTNFGPIVEGEIDLRPMTVFVGPSNTGKSYLAMLIYALHRFFGGLALDPSFGYLLENRSIFAFRPSPMDGRSITAKDKDELIGWAEDMAKGIEDTDWPERNPTQLPESIAKEVRHRLQDVSGFKQVLDNEFARCFGIEETTTLVRNGVRDGMKVLARRPITEAGIDAGAIEFEYSRRGDTLAFTASVPSATPLRATAFARSQTAPLYMGSLPFMLRDTRDRDTGAEEQENFILDVVLSELAGYYGSETFSPLTRMSYYLPADRTGIMHAHRVVVGSIIGQASRARFQRDTPLPQLSGVLTDFLEQLVGLGERRGREQKRPTRMLAEQIEEDILRGGISMSQSPVGYPEFFYRPDGWKNNLPLTNSSSMVSELAPVVLYLRHVVQAGDVLIIEEPESHLHPAMQVEFTRQLAAVVNAGVRVIITTHSEWVLDELTNLVHVSDLPEDRREGIGGADYALSRDQVGVWLFEPKQRPKGTKVKEIPFDADNGGFRSGFDNIAMGTYNDFAEISNRIEENKAEYQAD